MFGLRATRVLSLPCVGQLESAAAPNGDTGLLFQVIDTGPGLRGKDYRVLFDPTHEAGRVGQGRAACCTILCTGAMDQNSTHPVGACFLHRPRRLELHVDGSCVSKHRASAAGP